MRRLSAIVVTSVCAASLSVVSAAPAHAVGETFKVLKVSTLGCASGNFGMLVERTNLDGGTYIVRTVVTVAGKVYMNEQASISTNGQTGWSLFDNITYGPVDNKGVWPMPQNSQVRMSFTVERPKGTVLHAWSTVVDACNTGTMLFNGETSADVDQDLVTSVSDTCPELYGEAADGCPVFTRSLGLKYVDGKFRGKLKAPGAPALRTGQKIIVWKVRPGPDKRLGRTVTSTRGSYALAKTGKPGKYYATAAAVLIASAGRAPEVVSGKLALP
jgi:hypothetical protein